MLRRVDQLVAGFADGDAISHEARDIQANLWAMGLESGLYAPANRIGPGLSEQCRPIESYAGRPGDDVILHYSIASGATARFLASPARRILRYHNITPAEFFVGLDDGLAERLRAARGALKDVAAGADSVWADSGYNASELKACGIDAVSVVPLLFDVERFDVEPDPLTLAKFGGDLDNILFVGRMAPNKCVEELILAFAWHQRLVNSRSRLILVGSERSCPRYFSMLKLLAGRLDLANVCFEGFLNRSQLAACYRVADAFVCASRHEGYCLPLIEAMFHQVPVIARDMGGMPEALGGAGILYDDLDAPVLAELLGHVLTDGALRKDVMDSQGRRMDDIKRRDRQQELGRLLALEPACPQAGLTGVGEPRLQFDTHA